MPTNDGGDIQAATKAIELCAKQGIIKMCINTDSPFLINAATDWISKWKSRDWQQTPVKNKVDFCLLDRVMTANKNVEVKWKYVPANTRVLGNERVKTLAKEGALKNRVLGICSVCIYKKTSTNNSWTFLCFSASCIKHCPQRQTQNCYGKLQFEDHQDYIERGDIWISRWQQPIRACLHRRCMQKERSS